MKKVTKMGRSSPTTEKVSSDQRKTHDVATKRLVKAKPAPVSFPVIERPENLDPDGKFRCNVRVARREINSVYSSIHCRRPYRAERLLASRPVA
jgi:hypothetical protein